MKKKNGIKFISEKINELELLRKSYDDAIYEKSKQIDKINKQVDEYHKKLNDLSDKINKYKEIFKDLETEVKLPFEFKTINNTDNNTAVLNTNPINGLTDISHPLNKNVTPTTKTASLSELNKKKNRKIAIVCKDTDEFIEYINKIRTLTKFNPSVKNSIVEQSDGNVSYIKVSSILDVHSRSFDKMIILPFAPQIPDYKKIIKVLKPCIHEY